MHIELRTPGLKLPRARGLGLVRHARDAFARVGQHVERVLLRVSPAPTGRRASSRECVVEVHLADGRVERVHERHRRLGTLIRRTLERAWQLVAVRSGVSNGKLARGVPAALPAGSAPTLPGSPR